LAIRQYKQYFKPGKRVRDKFNASYLLDWQLSTHLQIRHCNLFNTSTSTYSNAFSLLR